MTFLNGIIQTIAGTGKSGIPATAARPAAALREPFMCAFDPAGNLVFSESRNYCVRRIDAQTGVITTLVGDGQPGYSGDGGPADRARLNEPYSLTVDDNGDIYIVDRLNAVVRKVGGPPASSPPLPAPASQATAAMAGPEPWPSYGNLTTAAWTAGEDC